MEQVISLVLDLSERLATESVELEAHLFAFIIRYDVYICIQESTSIPTYANMKSCICQRWDRASTSLLSNANLLANSSDRSTSTHGFEGEEVIACVRELVAIVYAANDSSVMVSHTLSRAREILQHTFLGVVVDELVLVKLLQRLVSQTALHARDGATQEHRHNDIDTTISAPDNCNPNCAALQ